jgi:F-type H+-transporting ATPase subunit epsilon
VPLEVQLVSPERILFSGEADMVITRTLDGEVAFLAGHAPFIGALAEHVARIRLSDDTVQRVAVHGGFVEVSANRCTLLSDVAELPEHIDLERARRAREAAEARLRDGDDAEAEAALRRAMVRIEVAEAR